MSYEATNQTDGDFSVFTVIRVVALYVGLYRNSCTNRLTSADRPVSGLRPYYNKTPGFGHTIIKHRLRPYYRLRPYQNTKIQLRFLANLTTQTTTQTTTRTKQYIYIYIHLQHKQQHKQQHEQQHEQTKHLHSSTSIPPPPSSLPLSHWEKNRTRVGKSSFCYICYFMKNLHPPPPPPPYLFPGTRNRTPGRNRTRAGNSSFCIR